MECLFFFSAEGCRFDSNATASWLQFMGSMAALMLAILLPEWNRRRQKKAEFSHVMNGVTMLITQMKTMTEKLPVIIEEGVEKNKISQIHHAYANALNGILNKLNGIDLLDVHNSRVLVAISLLQYGAEKGINEIVEKWPSLASDTGVIEVPESVAVFIKLIEQVEQKLANLPKP